MQSRCSRLHREHGGSEGAFTSPKSHFALRSLQCTCIEISVSDGPVPEGAGKTAIMADDRWLTQALYPLFGASSGFLRLGPVLPPVPSRLPSSC